MSDFFKKGETILIATHNVGKAKEFKDLFSNQSINTIFSKDLNIKEPEETGKTFKENSELKAKSAVNNGYIVVSDDSGLCVEALKNEPGIFSARWAKKFGGWQGAMEKIYKELTKSENQNFNAKYCCSLSIIFKNNALYSYYGEIKGKINWPPKGDNGFGYDPIFIPFDSDLTYGQQNKKEKMKSDHRSKAFNLLIKNHLDFTN